jgi:hypothetical protein
MVSFCPVLAAIVSLFSVLSGALAPPTADDSMAPSAFVSVVPFSYTLSL